MAEKIYVGQGKKVGQYGNISFSVCLDDMEQYAIPSAKNGKKYVNLIMSEMRQANQWGKTHAVAIDDWKPDPNYNKNTTQDNSANTPDKNSDEGNKPITPNDIPF